MAEDTVLTRREGQIEDLKDYLNKCQSDITGILERFDWTPEHFVQTESKDKCPYNNDHILPSSSVEKHSRVCQLVQQGCSRKDANEILDEGNFLKDDSIVGGSSTIGKELLNRILWEHHVKNHSIFYGQKEVPLTRTDEVCQLTPSERAAVYDHVVQKSKEDNSVIQQETDEFLTLDLVGMLKKAAKAEEQEANKSNTYIDSLKADRDYKRRRQTYRAKNVHITRKSYTEIIKQVIENQTEQLAEYIRQNEEDDNREETSDILPQVHPEDDNRTDRGRASHNDDIDDKGSDGPRSRLNEEEDAKYREEYRKMDRERDRKRERSYLSDESDSSSSRRDKKSHKKHKHKHHKRHKHKSKSK